MIILATGSRPRRPAEVPFDRERVLDSTSILGLRRLPERLLVVGGGVIACEFATMFAPLGVKVQLVDSHAHLLAYLDEDIQQLLAQQMLDMGIHLHLQTRVEAIRRDGDRRAAHAPVTDSSWKPMSCCMPSDANPTTARSIWRLPG